MINLHAYEYALFSLVKSLHDPMFDMMCVYKELSPWLRIGYTDHNPKQVFTFEPDLFGIVPKIVTREDAMRPDTYIFPHKNNWYLYFVMMGLRPKIRPLCLNPLK